MISRRTLIAACGCLAYTAIAESTATRAAPREWVCSTPDPAPVPGLSIRNYSADPSVENVQQALSVTNYGTAFRGDRWEPKHGLTKGTPVITLGVAFAQGTPPESAARVRAVAARWFDGPTVGAVDTSLRHRLAFRFDVPWRDAQIRIAFRPDMGNKSSVGSTENLAVRRNEPTMYIQTVEDYIILHEFGHALGLRHEQSSPATAIVWDEKAVIKELSEGPNKWTESYIRQTVINRFDSNYACIGDPGFNVESIMLYQIKQNWTKNNFVTPLNTRISNRDYKCLAGIYLDRVG